MLTIIIKKANFTFFHKLLLFPQFLMNSPTISLIYKLNEGFNPTRFLPTFKLDNNETRHSCISK